MQSLHTFYDTRVIPYDRGIIEIGLAGIIGYDTLVILGWVRDLLSSRYACYAHVGIACALSISMMTTSTADQIAHIATSIERCSPNCGAFAYSVDMADKIVASAIRRRAMELAISLVGAPTEELEAATAALADACEGDRWAAAEVSARFPRALLRAELVAAIRRHPRARKFSSLAEAISRGRYTGKQLAFAKRLAAEAPVAS